MIPQQPIQYTTYDGTLVVSPSNPRQYSFRPYPSVLLFTPDDAVSNYIFFRNGLLIAEYADYAAGPGYFAITADVLTTDTFTARSYRGVAASKLSLAPAGITAFGTRLVWLSPHGPVQTTQQPLMLFRNGQLLTPGADYTKPGALITLASAQQIIPATDTFSALIGTGGTTCTTWDGSITGAVNGSNTVFALPAGTLGEFLFRNGVLQTINFDYTRSGNVVTFVNAPVSTDTITAQAFSTPDVPGQLTTVDSTLTYAVAASAWIFKDGLFLTQPDQASQAGDTITIKVGA